MRPAVFQMPQPPTSTVSSRASSFSSRPTTQSIRLPPTNSFAAPGPESEPAPSSEWDYPQGPQLQMQSSFTSVMQPPPPTAPITTAESLTAITTPLPAQSIQAVPLPMEYEEVPPWNKPRSVDDIHFTYSMRCETTACRIFRVLALIFPAGLITVGATNLNHCPLVPWLPHWSMIVGCLWFVHCGFYFLFRKSNEKNTRGYRFIKGLYLYLVFGAFILGTALTYGTAITTRFVFRTSSCHPTLFFSAFGLISVGYLVLAVFLWFYIFTFTFSFYEPELAL